MATSATIGSNGGISFGVAGPAVRWIGISEEAIGCSRGTIGMTADTSGTADMTVSSCIIWDSMATSTFETGAV